MKQRRAYTLAIAIFFAVTMILTCVSQSGADAVTNHIVPELGIQFESSSKFLLGHYKTPLPAERVEKNRAQGLAIPFDNTFILVEQEELGKHSLNAVPPGEVATISLELRTGSEAQFRKKFCREDFKQQIGKCVVYKLSAYPGPYGEYVFYYLVDLPQGLLEITAQKNYLRNMQEYVRMKKNLLLTHYDKEIESIIKSIEVLKEPKIPQSPNLATQREGIVEAQHTDKYAIQASVGRYFLLRKDGQFGAVKIIQNIDEGDGNSGAEYEWYFQGDGSGNFLKNNCNHGQNKVFEKYKREKTKEGHQLTDIGSALYIKCGTFSVEWSKSNWIYFRRNAEISQTKWSLIKEIDVFDKKLKWLKFDPNSVTPTSLRE